MLSGVLLYMGLMFPTQYTNAINMTGVGLYQQTNLPNTFHLLEDKLNNIPELKPLSFVGVGAYKIYKHQEMSVKLLGVDTKIGIRSVTVSFHFN